MAPSAFGCFDRNGLGLCFKGESSLSSWKWICFEGLGEKLLRLLRKPDCRGKGTAFAYARSLCLDRIC